MELPKKRVWTGKYPKGLKRKRVRAAAFTVPANNCAGGSQGEPARMSLQAATLQRLKRGTRRCMRMRREARRRRLDIGTRTMRRIVMA